MKLNTFTCLFFFVLLCIFFLLFQKNPFVAIGLVVIVVGFKFAKTTINPMVRVYHELHAISHHLSQLVPISEALEKVTTQMTTDSEKQETATDGYRTEIPFNEVSEIDI